MFMLMEETGPSITATLTTAFQSMATDCLNVVAAILPIALGVVGSIVVVGFGIKVFKKVTGKA